MAAGQCGDPGQAVVKLVEAECKQERVPVPVLLLRVKESVA